MDAKKWTKLTKKNRAFRLTALAKVEDPREATRLANMKFADLPPGIRRKLGAVEDTAVPPAVAAAPSGEDGDNEPDVQVVAEAVPDAIAVYADGRAKVVNGTLTHWSFDRKENKGKLSVRDINGKSHTGRIPNVSTAVYALMNWFGSDTKVVYKFIEDPEAVIKKAKDSPRIFRFVDDVVFAVVSKAYKPFRAEDVSERIQALFPDSKLDVTPSDGVSGGYIRGGLGERGPFTVGVAIEFGPMNGLKAAKAVGQVEILACKNQMTMEVSPLMEDTVLPKENFSVRSTHRKSSLAVLLKSVETVSTALSEVGVYLEQAKKVHVSERQAKDILSFYVRRQKMSRKIADLIEGYLKDEKVQQVPGTLYGLAMVVTYVGTHPEGVKEGVQRALRAVGGEMILVSKKAKEYFSLVNKDTPEA